MNDESGFFGSVTVINKWRVEKFYFSEWAEFFNDVKLQLFIKKKVFLLLNIKNFKVIEIFKNKISTFKSRYLTYKYRLTTI